MINTPTATIDLALLIDIKDWMSQATVKLEYEGFYPQVQLVELGEAIISRIDNLLSQYKVL